MQKLRFFMDTHDKNHQTFPENISPEQFRLFFSGYEEACRAEGVIPVRLHVGFQDGRAFCLTMAESADAVRRAHERVGLPFDAITEIETATPADAFRHPSVVAR